MGIVERKEPGPCGIQKGQGIRVCIPRAWSVASCSRGEKLTESRLVLVMKLFLFRNTESLISL